MPISKDLFLSILAMDAYNRGYRPGVVLPASPPGSEVNIGHAKLSQNSEILGQTNGQYNDQAASFFAQAYTINDGSSYSNPGGDSLTGGQTVISYRGTDEPSPLKSADFWNGWTIGAGYSAASQAGLARSFYESVINAGNTGPQRTVFDVPPPGVVVTGHSLGGGLVSNDNAVLAEARAA